MLGNILWGMRVLGLRLLHFPYMRLWMNRQAKRLTTGTVSWEDRCTWWPAALRDLHAVCAKIVENKLVDVQRGEVVVTETIWADASLKGGAYILEEGGESESFPWSAKWKKCRIHLLEVEAMRM